MSRPWSTALSGALVVAVGCANAPEVRRPTRAEPVVAATATTEPRRIACSDNDARLELQYKTIPAAELDRAARSRPTPRLGPNERGTGNYLVSVAPDGHVTGVRIFESVPGSVAVAAALCQWTFAARPEPVRSVLFLSFHVTQR